MTQQLKIHHQSSRREDDDMISKVMDRFGKNTFDRSTPEFIAKIIYTAATDGEAQLRHLTGKDAERMYEAWKSMSNEDFFPMMTKISDWNRPKMNWYQIAISGVSPTISRFPEVAFLISSTETPGARSNKRKAPFATS